MCFLLFVLVIIIRLFNNLHCLLNMEIVSTNCKKCFVQTVLQIVNIVLQNVLIKYMIVQVQLLNIV